MKQRSAAEVANPVHELIEKRAKTTTTTIFLQRKQQFVWGAHSSLARSFIQQFWLVLVVVLVAATTQLFNCIG